MSVYLKEDGTRYEGCAFGPCQASKSRGGAGCYMCDVMPLKFPQPALGRAAALDLQKKDRAELKESEPLPDLSAPRAAAVSLGQKKRHREGPHRGNA